MKSALFVLLASTTLAGATVALAETADTAPTAATAAKPELGAFGFDEAGMNRTAKPGDDFYEYANGAWAKSTPIPSDRSNYGMFTRLDDISRARTREILDAVKDDRTSKIGNAYAGFLDEAAIEAKGLAPIKPWLDQIKGVKTKADYAKLVGQADRNGVGGPVGAFIGQDDKSPENYALTMFQSGIGMPDRDYYLSTDKKLAATRAAYLAHLEKVLTLAGEPNAAARAQALLAFETEIAKVHWTKIDSRDATKTYNKMTVAELVKDAPGFDFAAYFHAIGAHVDSLIVAQPSAVKGTAAIVANADLAVLKDAMLVRTLDRYSDYLPKAFSDESFAFYGTTLSGTPQIEPRWKRGVTFVTNSLSDEVSKLYVQRYFPPETKAAADTLVKNVIAAMDKRIQGLVWMAPETKTRARAKLAAFTPKIGYPDKWRDFSGLEIRRDDALGNAIRSANFEHDYNVGKLGKPIYRWEWGMTPMEVNAYANFSMNEIVFPAAILQPPFFDPHADPAVNYGGIGAVIGHEISHHFDDQGSKYDATGTLTDWWTADDVKKFNALTAQLVAQYDAYEPLPGEHVKGQLTLGENIADLAGLTVAHEAYKASLGGKPAPVIDGFTGDQRFYLGWAQVWRRNYREANLRQRLLTDSHSPSAQRTWVVRNLDPWYGAYNPDASAKLYLSQDKRVRIW